MYQITNAKKLTQGIEFSIPTFFFTVKLDRSETHGLNELHLKSSARRTITILPLANPRQA